MEKRIKGLMIGQALCYTILALSVFTMYFINSLREAANFLFYLRFNGAIFWLSILLIVLLAILQKSSARSLKNYSKRINQKIEFLRFFSNRFAIVADIILILSIACLVTLLIMDNRLLLGTQQQIFIFLCMSVFVFALGMHNIFNSNIYEFISRRKGGKRNV